MAKRVLNIYLYRQSEQLILRMIDVYPMTVHVTESNGFTVISHNPKDYLNDIGDVLEHYWFKLNHFYFFDNEMLGIDPKYHIKSCFFDSQFVPLTPEDRSKWLEDPGRREFSYTDMCVKLPQDEASLLRLLIGLDPFISDVTLNLSNEAQIHYHDEALPAIPSIQNHIAALFNNQAPDKVDKDREQSQFSRYVINWLITELSDKALISTLRDLLATEQKTLTQAIRERLYPGSAIHYFIERNCTFYKDDRAMPALLNPDISCKEATEILKEQLSLQKHSGNKGVRKVTRSGWFDRYWRMRQSMWEDILATVIGQPVNDDEIYMNKYTEIQLLKQAVFSLSSEGDMLLHYGNTTAYKNNYAPGKHYHDVLEKELRVLCDLIGLHFLPDQKVHEGTIRFDRESTAFLMNCGFHITEEDCKLLLQSQHRYGMFHGDTATDTEALDSHVLPGFSS